MKLTAGPRVRANKTWKRQRGCYLRAGCQSRSRSGGLRPSPSPTEWPASPQGRPNVSRGGVAQSIPLWEIPLNHSGRTADGNTRSQLIFFFSFSWKALLSLSGLSAAFDTVDHFSLLEGHKLWIGTSGTYFKLFYFISLKPVINKILNWTEVKWTELFHMCALHYN